ncbi:hypothetical protein ABT084_36380 [Streptomyces sp. NPDC002138]|uniref:hypothetical protein n=1 Tax=Streptomyces sp. NPDC002138 TaxID=3154410 RepID=UPI0033224E75
MSASQESRLRQVALINGSFEEPAIPAGTHQLIPDASQTDAPVRVQGWRTTAPDHTIEIWRAPSQDVSAAVGTQFAELNSYTVSTLYQDLETTPGTTLHWSLYHRGRLAENVMALDIGAPGTMVEQRRMADGNTAWRRYTGTYTVPNGQTITRFSLRPVAAAGSNQAPGNLLDGISFGTEKPTG